MGGERTREDRGARLHGLGHDSVDNGTVRRAAAVTVVADKVMKRRENGGESEINRERCK